MSYGLSGTRLQIDLTAVDNASSTINKVGSNAKSLVLGFNNLASSALNLYNMVDRVRDSQVALDRANLVVMKSSESVRDAQNNLNKVLEKYGEGSTQAVDAQNRLMLAQESYKVATERADMASENQRKTMMTMAVSVIPTLITGITGVISIIQNWGAVTQALSGAMTFLSANPIILVIAGIALLIAGIIYAYNNCKPFRDLINTIGAYLQGAFLAAWNAVSGAVSWFNTNVIQPVSSALSWFWNNVLIPLAKFLVGTLLAEWNALSAGWSWAYNHLIKPVFDALVWAYNNILKPIADFFAGIGAAATSAAKTVSTAVSTIGGTTTVVPVSGGAIPHGAEGGIITRPTVMLAGEGGPEALIPLDQMGFGARIEINSPLVYVAGSADERTVDLAVKKVEKILDNIILEASSSGGSSTHKRVRIGTGRF
jgi:hypothetical protein